MEKNRETNREYENSQRQLETASAEEVLIWAAQNYPEKVVFASSFSAEDMVLLHIISKLHLPIEIITLDTGRLPEETYSLMAEVREKYPLLRIKSFSPAAVELEKLTSKKGFFSFRESIENRKECCRVRKIEPLQRALQGAKAWITGIRKSQSITRTIAQKLENDPGFNILKINPLLEWTEQEVWNYLQSHNVPYNQLHDKGYPSIGCAPCTRAIKPGEDVRAGRWWWENPEQRECGLHGYCERKKESSPE